MTPRHQAPTGRRIVRDERFIRDAMSTHGGTVWRLALCKTGSYADAQDVYQDVFISLACDSTMFESAEHLKAWLIRTTANRCHDHARGLVRRLEAISIDELDFDPIDPASQDEPPLTARERRRIWQAFAKLPANQRAALYLHHVEDMPCSQVADALGRPESTIRTWLQRARKQLEQTLGGLR